MSDENQPIVTQTTQEPADPNAIAPAGTEGQPPTAPVPPVQSQEELDFAKRFTALTRKEREILAREERLRPEITQLQEWKKNQEMIKSNPLKFLESQGWDFNKLADFALNDQKPTQNQVIETLQKQIEDLRREREEEKHQSKQSEVEKNIQAYKDNLKADLQSKADQYELLNQFEGYDLVYDTMNDHFMKTMGPNGEPGEILDIDKVAASVEKYYEDQLERATKTKKFSTRFTPSVKDEQKTEGSKGLGDRSDSPKTLTNETVSGSGSSGSSEYLDEEASKRRSAKILEEMWARNKK